MSKKTGKKSPSKKGASRRTASKGGAPARSRRKPGNPGFAGYEYQIDVTIWVALDLILAKGVTAEVEIEPRSDEDIQAAVKDPSAASLGLIAQGNQLELIFQAKTRSGAPWSTTAIADVLLGKDSNEAGKGGKRSRPLAMLQADAGRRYIFVTNEASAGSLRPHEGTHLFDFPEVDKLPPYARAGYDSTTQASLSARILLLTGITREVLASRIGILLSQHGHVPISKHEKCLRDLRESVRKRIAGELDVHWTRSAILDVLIQYGGSLAPTRDMDRYVRPRSFDAIKNKLDEEHAVVICGPSGTGKTLTADILELELRGASPAYEVIGEEKGPGYIRQNLTRTDPMLFHLRDPWGENRLMPGADRWGSELLKLLDNAGPGRKFLVTSRSDVLQSAGHELMKGLRPYAVSIEVEDYGSERLAEIYDGIAADLGEHAKQLAVQYRGQALKKLTRPYEVKRFLVALGRETLQKSRNVADVLAESQIEAISQVIADQIAPLGADGGEAATIIWAMLSARGAIARDAFAKLGRRLRLADSNLRPDIDGLIDFLVAGQNLRQDGAGLAFYHPRVEDGLRLAFMCRPRDAEHTLSSVVDVLLAWDATKEDWGLETGLSVLRAAAKIKSLQLDLSPASRQQLDQHLESVALSADKRADFERALSELKQFGSEKHAPTLLAKILIEGAPDTETYGFLRYWRAPSLEKETIELLKNDGRTQPMVDRFIREVLPFSDRRYRAELAPLLEGLSSGLRDAYWDALDSIVGPGGPQNNIEAIVVGALMESTPDYERAIERFARSASEADAWFERFADDLYQAEEHAVDANIADHIFEQPSEEFINAREGMRAVVRFRRARDGVMWIATNPNSELLLYALGELIADSPHAPPIEELEFLLTNADGWVRDQAWRAAKQHWDDSLGSFLLDELARVDIADAGQRHRLIEIASNHGRGDPIPDIAAVFERVPFFRRLELIYDVFATKLDSEPKGKDSSLLRHSRAAELLQFLTGDECELAHALLDVITGRKIQEVATSLSESTRGVLDSTLTEAPVDLTGPLACLAAAAGLNVDVAIARLLSTDSAAHGEAAIVTIVNAGDTGLRERLHAALGHKRYDVRRHALEVLAADATEKERDNLISVAEDHSSDVRLAFCNLMAEHCWPEAIDTLIRLLGDTRDFANYLSVENSSSAFSVARAAARALEAYETLPLGAVDALLKAAQADGSDPFVACASLSALASKDDPRIVPVLLSALKSQEFRKSPALRPHAQAAAWAAFDRVISGRSDILTSDVADLAGQGEPIVAGPLLLAFGICEGEERDSLLKKIHAVRHFEREAVIRTAAIAANAVAKMSLDAREKILWRLTLGETLEELTSEDRALVEAWSQTLEVDGGFERFIAWVADLAFKLPLNDDVGKIRAFDLPKRTRVMTLRSFSPYREKGQGHTDDYT